MGRPSAGRKNVDFAHGIPEIWLNRVRSNPDVQQAEPYIVAKGIASLPGGGFEDVWIIGCDATSMLGGPWAFEEGEIGDLRRPNGITIDTHDAEKLGNPEVGEQIEVNGHRARIVAKTKGITGFVLSPYLFTTMETARKLGQFPAGECSYVLVRAKPGVNHQKLKQSLQHHLPDADVHTKSEFSQLSQDYFLNRTGIGVSFGAATLLGLLVGLLMVAQSLYALALDHLGDYATLKAIGADDRQVQSVIVSQAIAIAAVGTLIGVGIVLLIKQLWTSRQATISISYPLLGGGIVLVFVICVVATLLPVYRIRRVDPAIVLQG